MRGYILLFGGIICFIFSLLYLYFSLSSSVEPNYKWIYFQFTLQMLSVIYFIIIGTIQLEKDKNNKK
ncbi:hypothetical protein GCM10008967_27970 [Bacillus carboniphilus]|uniref:Lipoprotein n=1 Tax=Bacillus carboniphilus TaxID=86663 RepID=A0ABN0WFM5_9BACI